MRAQFIDFWYYFKQNRGALAGLAVIFIFFITALLAPLFAPHNPAQIFPEHLLQRPFFFSEQINLFLGSDDVGRDLLSRLIYGARISMGIGLLVVIFSTSIGTMLGLISGYVGGRIDWFIMRVVDMMMSLPSILLAIFVVSVLGPNLLNGIIAVSVVAVPSFIRIVRASVLEEKKRQYVMASQTFGSSHWRILFINIFPNVLAPLIVQATLGFSDGILNAAALGFLGLGAQPPTAEWGTMLADSRAYIESAPWLVTLPGLCILMVVLAFNLLGDGLRDAFDPRLKK
ncbi:MAG: diguanylate cyclase [Bdellovibrionales bacterium RIFOXYD12_FULL_39_22]|nr:MAG: diguanylate cyclase [Bdellovibrionales bacterium RIFOXYB1_FULL_39_21]OFZ42652.1 MAG: diguanylate cyclase [Bdellovibrionales bacterium RIFOXYC12_FULL_39_17]OFZ47080.1 MAG: diguanylate cyclase [Bdellovibrionales bacterium RIFOXYC1_FULL_39_130]OFZ75328.1 MAG: diguanylate cyclase [Bdellovibrionales bacterium RIFOXYD1_FULL_39_84]OFZ93279.1 MAG: diguanylate cyclase [Bdellovibrionales bacterium RIFOXYD12_FULL_39_22]HLE10046.1 ABC transporter permease subunit [Bacteriovoracaceae bacterium]